MQTGWFKEVRVKEARNGRIVKTTGDGMLVELTMTMAISHDEGGVRLDVG
jgi:hypothetical protein